MKAQQFRPQARLHEASTTKKHTETDNAISVGLTLHSAKTSKQHRTQFSMPDRQAFPT